MLRRLFSRARRPSESEIARELQDHLDLETEHVAAKAQRLGKPGDDAAFVARRLFGNVGLVQEDVRHAWGSLWFERLMQDVRYGFRLLRRTPGFSIIAVLCLGLGIGANAAVFSWTEGILLRPYPGVAEQDRLVAVANTAPGMEGFDGMSWPDFNDLQARTSSFSAFIGAKITGATLTGGDRAEPAVGLMVAANYFSALGVRPMLGRGFLPGEDVGRGAHPVTLISYRLWRDRFGGDPSIVGKTLNLNGVPHTIIGVTPPEFLGTFVGYAMQFWVPMSQQPVLDPSGNKLEERSARWVEGFARLKPGVSLAQAQNDVAAAARQLEAEYPDADRGRGIRLLPLWESPFDAAQELRPMLRAGFVVGLFVLLIACANVANLLLVKSFARGHEMTVRVAVGAGRARLLRQLITEGAILAALASALGLLVAYWCRNLLVVFFAPRGAPSVAIAGGFGWRVLALSLAIGLLSTLLFALVPALQTSAIDVAGALRATMRGALHGRSVSSWRSALVLVQVALSFALLVGSGLVLASLQRIRTVNPGFTTEGTVTTVVNLFAAGYDTLRARRFEDDLLERVRAMAGVQSAALARSTPFSRRPYERGPIAVDGYVPAPEEQPTADYNSVTPGYFATMGIRLVEGRDFMTSDGDTTAPVAIVGEALAAKYWPGSSPLGRRLQLRGRWMQVVGVAADIKHRSLLESPSALFYVPMRQSASSAVALFIRDAEESASIGRRLIREIHALDANVSPSAVVSLRAQVDLSTVSQRIAVSLLSAFAALALCLAAIGLYGVMSYAVSQSNRELGLRKALGASPGQMMRLILSGGLRLTVAGVALGAAGAWGTTRLLGDLLYRVSPRDPATFASALVVMLAVSVIACLVPALRAARSSPMAALRT